MNFFKYILDKLRGIVASISTGFTQRNYVFGTIISGSYNNYKHDPTPTIFCCGNYFNPKKNRWYLHGINIHYLDYSELQWFMNTIYMMKRGGQIVDPRMFYQYIKFNRPLIIKKAYRVYHTELCKYYTISPGFSNLQVKSCYTVKDQRDGAVIQLNNMINASYNVNLGNNTNPVKVSYNENELQEHIQYVLNSRKVFP